MTAQPTPTPKDYLYLFVAQFSMAALLLDMLPPRMPIQRDMAMAISMSDTIKKRLEAATDTERRGMLIASRENLKALVGTVQAGAFPVTAGKVRREWISVCKQLLKDSANV